MTTKANGREGHNLTAITDGKRQTLDSIFCLYPQYTTNENIRQGCMPQKPIPQDNPQAQLDADSWAFLAWTCPVFRQSEVQRIEADIAKLQDDYLFCLQQQRFALANAVHTSLLQDKRILELLRQVGGAECLN